VNKVDYALLLWLIIRTKKHQFDIQHLTSGGNTNKKGQKTGLWKVKLTAGAN
jgi:hypothetical protein